MPAILQTFKSTIAYNSEDIRVNNRGSDGPKI